MKIEEEYEYELCFDKPIQYKNFYIYPVTIEDYIQFNRWVNSLLIDKDKVANPEIMRMSYFKYLQTTEYFYLFILLLQLVTKIKILDEDNNIINKKNEPVFNWGVDEKGNSFFILEGFVYYSEDFEKIKKIICLQNNIEIEESITIDSKMKEKLDDALKFVNKNSGEVASLKDLISRLAVYTGFTKEYIKTLTIMTFHDMLDSIDILMNYKIYKTGEASGMVTYKEPIPHWKMKPKKKSKYDSVMSSIEELKNKIS